MSILFGWQQILTGLILLVVLAAIFFLVLAAGRGRQGEWQAFLDSRASGHPELTSDGDDAAPTTVSRSRPR